MTELHHIVFRSQGMREKTLFKPFKRVEMTAGEYLGSNVVKRLMGGRFY